MVLGCVVQKESKLDLLQLGAESSGSNLCRSVDSSKVRFSGLSLGGSEDLAMLLGVKGPMSLRSPRRIFHRTQINCSFSLIPPEAEALSAFSFSLVKV